MAGPPHALCLHCIARCHTHRLCPDAPAYSRCQGEVLELNSHAPYLAINQSINLISLTSWHKQRYFVSMLGVSVLQCLIVYLLIPVSSSV